jgi:hypothetical protein
VKKSSERDGPARSPADELIAALANLGERRHSMQTVTARYREESFKEGDHRMAAVWQGIALAVAEIEDDERDVLAGLEDPPGVATIVDDTDEDSSA